VALTPQDNEAFFREVDEKLREQQVIDLWKRHSRTLILSVIGLLVAVGAVLFWQSRQRDQAEGHAEALSAAVDLVANQGQPKAQALKPLEQAPQDGYRAASRLLAADLALKRGDVRQAAKEYGAVATDAGLAQPYRDLALVRQTAAEFDSLPPATVIQRMKPLAVAGSPWLGSAGEMLAAAYVRQGKPSLAGPVFAMIARDTKTPESLRSRASQMAAMLGTDAGTVPAAKE
jgi:hypothetical protein